MKTKLDLTPYKEKVLQKYPGLSDTTDSANKRLLVSLVEQAQWIDAINKEDSNFLDDLQKQTQKKYKKGLSNDIFQSKVVRYNTLMDMGAIRGYFGAKAYRTKVIDHYIEEQLKNKGYSNDQIATIFLSKRYVYHLEESFRFSKGDHMEDIDLALSEVDQYLEETTYSSIDDNLSTLQKERKNKAIPLTPDKIDFLKTWILGDTVVLEKDVLDISPRKTPYVPENITESDLQNFTITNIPSGMDKLPDIQVAIHPANNDIIVINYPGVLGDINGYADKYLKLAAFIQKNIGTAVRISGPDDVGDFEMYQKGIQQKLKQTIKHILSGENTDSKKIYLVGFSAGASGIAAVASEFPQVKKILLMAPSGDAGRTAIEQGLAEYTGELYTINGANDRTVGPDSGKIFSQSAKKASLIKTVIIPNCDHQFRGEENGKIMSSAPLWAFLDKEELRDMDKPDISHGIKLYD